MIKLIEVTNPLQPSVGKVTREIEWTGSEVLDDFLLGHFAETENLTVSLNGKVIGRDLWFATQLRDEDCVVCIPTIAGGSLLRTLASVSIMVASIAVGVLTAGAASPLTIAGLTLSSSVLGSLAAGAVAIAGNLLVSAFLNTPSNKTNTPTYAFDGPHSLAQSGVVIPKGYGTFQWGGNIIASFIDVEGADQYLNCLVCFGFGPARSITNLQLNGKDISEYGNVQYYVRYGTNDQTPLPNFNRVVNGYPQTVQCLAGVPVIVPGTGTLTQILQVDIVAPSGLWILTNDGNLIVCQVLYLVEYSVAGAGIWQPVVQPLTTTDVVTFNPLTGIANPFPIWCAVATDLPPNSGVVYSTGNGSHSPGDPYTATQTITITHPDSSTSTMSKTVTGEWQLTDPKLNQVLVTTWSAGYIEFGGCDQSQLYNRTTIYGLAPGMYDIRVTKYGSGRIPSTVQPGDNFSANIGQDIWIHSVNEISLLDLAYPNLILVGVRALATGQLSGSQINITAKIVHGLRTLDNNILPGALQVYEEDNPACVAADMMLDGLYGGGQSPGIVAANIDRFIDEWVAWAELNDELVPEAGVPPPLPPPTVPSYTPPPGAYMALVYLTPTVTFGGTAKAFVTSGMLGGLPTASMEIQGTHPPITTADRGTATASWPGTSMPPLPVGSTVVSMQVVASVSSSISTADCAFSIEAVTVPSNPNGTYVGSLPFDPTNPGAALTSFHGFVFFSYSLDGAIFDDTLGAAIFIAVFYTLPLGYIGPIPPPALPVATSYIRRHVFNGIFDNESNLWDQLSVVGRMSRAQLIPLGRDYGVFVDKLDNPCQIFTMGNIVQDSFNETWLAIDDRANQVEIQFADSTRFYKQDNPIVYMDPAQQDSGVVIKNVRIDGKGITIPAQAWQLARFKQRCNEFLLRTGSFKCDVDAIASRPGNVVILQHDVPEWGWGGRTLPGSTTTSILVDRNDLPFVGGTSYSLIVLFAALSRYTGTVTSVAAVTDVTGANVGTQLNLSSFNNLNRVTRAVVVASGVSYDCPITSTAAGLVIIQPIAGFTPAGGQTYTLYDTDVMITSTVTAATATTITLGTPLPQAPDDYATYFYGPVGSQKLVRITSIRKASEFRATVEWIDYDPNVYLDGVPLVGSTSAQIASNPAVTSVVGNEVLVLVSGAYLPFAAISWQLGPDTVGVSIYAAVAGAPVGSLPQMVARLTNFPTSWQVQIAPGVATTYTVVGFDVNGNYANFSKAPQITVTGLGPTENLLLNSNFSDGYTFWTPTPRAGDSFIPDLLNGGEAVYTVAGTALAMATTLLSQPIPQSEWAIGDYLMLSAYFKDTAVSTANVGNLVATITFLNSTGGTISSVSATAALSGTSPGMVRVNTASTIIPALTVGVLVTVGVAGGGLSVKVGSTLSMATLLLELSTSTQTSPSPWAGSPVGNQLSTYTNNPQISLTQPTSTTIALAAAAVTFGALTVNYSARTFTIAAPSVPTWYYVTIADLAQAGESGAVLAASCVTTTASVGVQGQTYMGAILALPAGSATVILPGGWPAPQSAQVVP